MDQEKSGQFKARYCILNATGVKETDEPVVVVVVAAMLTHPPGLVLNPIGRMREREREEANEGREGGGE